MPTALIRTSVRDLVAFALRSGDLMRRFVSSERLVQGTRGHQKVQRSRPPGYQMEVQVSHLVEAGAVSLEISGRIDGLMVEENAVVVEEIKSTQGPRDADEPDDPHHWGQAKVYGYIVAVQSELDEIDVQITYVQLDSGELQEDRRRFRLDELAAFFDDLVGLYLKWAAAYQEWCQQRDQSIHAVDFPFPEFRRGQRPLSLAVYRTVHAQNRLFAQAPTGIGKTVSVLFAAIKAMGRGGVEKIFYLTAKTSGRFIAEKTLVDLRQQGLKLKSLTLTARDKICFKPAGEGACDPDHCEFAIGYFDRINGALEDIYEQSAFTRPVIEEWARKHQVCPFEFSLDLSLWVDAIICDYNYVFDPKAYLKRFFLDHSGDYVFLIDEAHNLVDRAREMFSASLHKREVLALKRAVKDDHPGLARRLEKINTYLLGLRRLCQSEGRDGGWVDPEPPRTALPLLQSFAAEADQILARNRPTAYRELLLDFYFQVIAFQRIAELFDDHYTTYAQHTGRDLHLRLFCLDPSVLVRQALKRGTSAVFFSATLTPLDYFREVLGGDEEDPLLNLESPFPREHLHLTIGDHIATTYKMRERTAGEVAASIAALVAQRQGNYLVFFPSYRYMQSVAEGFVADHPEWEILVQQARMSEPQREEFLARFDTDNQRTTLGFAVMGGIFGEGIDLMGERLVGAVVVGVGLPQICLERDLIRGYYDAREVAGFEYAYTYPGMNRVLQAVGRVIRSSEDRGAVLLIDQRFSQERYRRLFPAGWHPAPRAGGPDRIGRAVGEFWQRQH